MSTNASNPPRRRAGAIALTAGLAAIGLASSPVAATSAPPDTSVGAAGAVLIDAGDLSRPVELNPIPTVGEAATNTKVSTTTGTLDVNTPQQTGSVAIDVTTTVVESGEITAADDTGITMRRRVESRDVVDNSSRPGAGESFASDEELAELVGIELDYLFGPDNRLQDVVPAEGVELTAAQLAAVDEVIANGQDKAELPTEPVGVGAQWTAEMPGNSALVATYTLVSLVGSEYTVEVEVSGDGLSFFGGALPNGFDEVSGGIDGTGTLVGNTDQPLVRTASVDIDVDLTLTGEAGEMTMRFTTSNTETAVAS